MKKILKKLQKKIWCMVDSFGRAWAASSLAKQGYYQESRAIMIDKKDYF